MKKYQSKLKELNQSNFNSLVRHKKVCVVYGCGVSVDKQKIDIAEKAMEEVLERYFPDHNITILQCGRFGFPKRETGWEFDSSMTGQGHPEHWIPGSRGYYAITKNSAFLFPKSDRDFENEFMKKFFDFTGIKVYSL
jgi:hypothetical protein